MFGCSVPCISIRFSYSVEVLNAWEGVKDDFHFTRLNQDSANYAGQIQPAGQSHWTQPTKLVGIGVIPVSWGFACHSQTAGRSSVGQVRSTGLHHTQAGQFQPIAI